MKIIFTTILLFTVNVGSFAVTELSNASTNYIDKTYLEAVKLFEQQKYEDSLNKIRHVIKSSMHSYKLRYLAAHNHWRQKHHKVAAQHFLIGIAQKPQNYHGYIDLSLMYLDQYNYTAARNILNKCERILNNAKKHVPAKLYNIQARINLRWENPQGALQKSQQAKAAFQKKNTGIKDQLESLILEGRAYLSLNKFSKAEFALSWGLSLHKDNATVLNLLGYTFEQWAASLKKKNPKKSIRKRSKAIAYYKKALITKELTSTFFTLIQRNLKRIETTTNP